jgi:hypothetical protein
MKAHAKTEPSVWFAIPRLVGARTIFISALIATSLLMLGVQYWQAAVVVGMLHCAHIARLEARKIELGAIALFVAVALWWVDVKPFNTIYAQLGSQISLDPKVAETNP